MSTPKDEISQITFNLHFNIEYTYNKKKIVKDLMTKILENKKYINIALQ